jgi:hypothetical protein
MNKSIKRNLQWLAYASIMFMLLSPFFDTTYLLSKDLTKHLSLSLVLGFFAGQLNTIIEIIETNKK